MTILYSIRYQPLTDTNSHNCHQGEACSVLPGDLQERYKSWCRQGRQQQVSAAVTQVQEHLQQSKELYDQVPQVVLSLQYL